MVQALHFGNLSGVFRAAYNQIIVMAGLAGSDWLLDTAGRFFCF